MFSCLFRSKTNDIDEDYQVPVDTRGEITLAKKSSKYTEYHEVENVIPTYVDDRYEPEDIRETVDPEDIDDKEDINDIKAVKYDAKMFSKQHGSFAINGKRSTTSSQLSAEDNRFLVGSYNERHVEFEDTWTSDHGSVPWVTIPIPTPRSECPCRPKQSGLHSKNLVPILKKRNNDGGVMLCSDAKHQETVYDLQQTFTNSRQKADKQTHKIISGTRKTRNVRKSQPLPSFIRKLRNTEEDYGFVPLPMYEPLKNQHPLATDVLSNFRIGQSEGKVSTPIIYDEKPTHLYRARSANFPCKVTPDIDRPKSARELERKKGTLMILPKEQAVNAAALNRYIQKLSMAVKINNRHLFPGLSVTNIDFLKYGNGSSSEESLDKLDQCKQEIYDKVIVEEDETDERKTWLIPQEEAERKIWQTVSKLWHLGDKWRKVALQE